MGDHWEPHLKLDCLEEVHILLWINFDLEWFVYILIQIFIETLLQYNGKYMKNLCIDKLLFIKRIIRNKKTESKWINERVEKE